MHLSLTECNGFMTGIFSGQASEDCKNVKRRRKPLNNKVLLGYDRL
jgi:hypothetical protein